MPVDHSKNGFLKDIGTDWVALSANGTPLSRAATEASVRRAVPDAAEYITTVSGEVVAVEVRKAPDGAEIAQTVTEEPEPAPAVEPAVEPEPVVVEPEAEQPKSPEPVAVDPRLDADGDGKMGGSLPGEDSTVAKGRRKRKPAA